MFLSSKFWTMFFSTLFAVVLFFTFENLSQSIEFEKQILLIEKKVGRLEIIYGSISNMISNDYKKQGYDKLQAEWKKFEILWEKLEQDGLRTIPDHQSVIEVFSAINESMDSVYNSILRYQSSKAIRTNSLFYLKDLYIQVSTQKSREKISDALTKLLFSILFADVNQAEFDLHQQTLVEMLSSKDLKEDIQTQLLLIHLKSIQKQKNLLSKHIKHIEDVAINEKLYVLEDKLVAIVDKERQVRNRTSVLISLVALIMLVGLIVVLYRLIHDKERILRLQKEREQQMQLLNEYRRAMDAGMIVSKTDTKGFITYANEKFCTMSGYTEKELLGKPHNIVRHSDMPKELFKQMWKTIKAKEIFQGMIKNKKKDNGDYYVDATIVPILDKEGEITEYIAIRTDITELVEAKVKAEEAQKAKDSFLASMSHELRTPLNAIIGFSQILMAKPDTPDGVKGYVEKIQISGKNLLELVNTILDFSKIEAGKMDYRPEVQMFKDIVDEVTLLAEPLAQKKEVELNCMIHDDMIYADAQLIKQLLLNLVSNAIKFSPENTDIEILYELHDDKQRISVRDYGMGIEAELIPTLFDPFTQIQRHQKHVIKGTGLGLAIAKRIVEMHHGRIWIESEVGKGSTFYIELPIKA